VRHPNWYEPLARREHEATRTPRRNPGNSDDTRRRRTAGGCRPSKSTVGARAHGSQVVGYFIEWGIYGRNYKVKNVETSGSADRLTVINYAFGNVAPDSTGSVVCKLGDEWADYQKPWTAEEP
jgi:chitinase